jgi:NAD(P)-dependent dehydrogenase (short-subunit alcohol dehydrogenase family)
MANVENKSVIITGGAGDIAKVATRKFLDGGARVMLVDINEEALEETVASMDSYNVSYFVGDVTSKKDSRAYVEEANTRHGGIDVLLANAGVEGEVASLPEYDTAIFDKVMAVNVRGVFLGLKYVFPVMAAAGGGGIIITSSVAGVSGARGVSAYNASKHAVIGLMRAAAREGGAANIRVNTVNPAPVEGRMMASLEAGLRPDDSEAAREDLVDSIPLERYALPEDVANLMLFLASEEATYLTGSVYMVDGGMRG